jgi:hypothetical protein
MIWTIGCQSVLDCSSNIDLTPYPQDKLCKICYACELPFTMYRRRHHCRMCGQVFCNQCSSYYIERDEGPVRSCRLCYEQLGDSFERDTKLKRKTSSRKLSDSSNPTSFYESLAAGLIKDAEEGDGSRSISGNERGLVVVYVIVIITTHFREIIHRDSVSGYSLCSYV